MKTPEQIAEELYPTTFNSSGIEMDDPLWNIKRVTFIDYHSPFIQ